MSSLKLDFDSFKSSGVYTLEYDNTIQEINEADSFRLAVGFTEHGPFNRPVFLNGQSDRRKIFGNTINTKLERRGSFFDRSLEVLLSVEPTISLNLLNVDENDKVGYATFALSTNDSSVDNHEVKSEKYSEFFDKSKFWIPSTENLRNVAAVNVGVDYQKEVNKAPIFSVVNLGTQDVTVFVLKDKNVVGYNMTANDWYSGEIPYQWIQPTDFISDYFIRVIAVKGDWSDVNSLSHDKTWKQYFTKSGLNVDMASKFISNDNVTLIGNWSGCIIPNFYNKSGKLVSIEPILNNSTVQTGIMISFNEFAMESLINDPSTANQYYDGNLNDEFDDEDNVVANYKIDMVGHFVNSNSSSVSMLSYVAKEASSFISEVEVDDVNGNTFIVAPTTNDAYLTSIQLGSMVEADNGYLTKIIKKIYNKETNKYEFTCNDSVKVEVKDEEVKKIKIHKQLTEVFDALTPSCLKGLKITNKHRPGFDASGNVDVEGGVKKIYSMLEDEGIRRGLKNKDMVSFRYLIDTMDGGIGTELGGKKYLADLAREVGQCTAIINFPSVSLLKRSNDPIFCDVQDANSVSKPFNTKYISTGGNPDSYISEPLSMPIKEHGADYAAAFSPFLKYATGSQTILMPPAAHIANAFMSKYNGGNPYATIANTNGYLNDGAIVGLEYMYDNEDRDSLEPFGINPIVIQNGRFTIYGNRTCYQEVLSDLNYLHVRELLNKLELEAREVLKPFVFRTNNSIVRAECVRTLTPIFEAALLSGALYDYEIIMDETNNTDEVIARAFGVVDIKVQVNKNMEKIVQRITLEKISQ